MDEALFNELLCSVEQMQGIVRGNLSPSRVFDLELPVNETTRDVPQA